MLEIRLQTRADQADMQVSFSTQVKWKQAQTSTGLFGGGGSLEQGQLDLNTAVEVGMTLPPPLSFLPSFLLKQAGGMVLKAASAAILPRFGQLVAEDYRRWSLGLPRVGGSLAPDAGGPPSSLETIKGLEQKLVEDMSRTPYYTPPPAQAGMADQDARVDDVTGGDLLGGAGAGGRDPGAESGLPPMGSIPSRSDAKE